MAITDIKVNTSPINVAKGSPFTTKPINAGSVFNQTSPFTPIASPSKTSQSLAVNQAFMKNPFTNDGSFQGTNKSKNLSVYEAPKKSTTVISSSDAKNQVTNVIKPTVDSAQQSMANQKQKQETVSSYVPPSTDKYNMMTGERNPNYIDPNKNKEQTAEDAIMKQPDEGTYFAYDIRTGKQLKLNEGDKLPNGYTTENPVERTDVQESIIDDFGNEYRKFSDGTYGRFDPAGNYIGSNATSFNNAKQVGEIRDKVKQIINGTYPLTDTQKAQIEGVQSEYQKLIQKDEELNANVTGGMTIAQNLYGTGNTIVGQQQIAKTVRDGLDTIKQDQLALASAVAKMSEGFNQDNMALLKESYDNYVTANSNLQKNIDYINEVTRQSAKDTQDALDQKTEKDKSFALQQMNNYPDAEILPTDDPMAVSEKILNSQSYRDSNSTAPTTAQVQSTVNQIAANLDNEPIIKSYNIAKEGFNTVSSIGANTKNPADDIAFIYAFAKIMDPGSVVREGEYNTIQKYAQSWADTFGFKAKRVFSNTNFLSSDAKQKMLNSLAPKVQSLTDQYNQVRSEYQRQIDDAYAGKPRTVTDYTVGGSGNTGGSTVKLKDGTVINTGW